jgi:hypothetical protein
MFDMTKLKRQLSHVEHIYFGGGAKETKFTPFIQFGQEA